MTSRTVKRLYDLEIDEISLVDRPANQHGVVAIAKRAEEGAMPVYDADGYEVDESSLQVGDVVYDASGVEHVMLDPETAAELGYGELEDEMDIEDAEFETEEQEERVPALAGVGKRKAPAGSVRKGAKTLGQQVLEDLSKALGESDRDEVISKLGDLVAESREESQRAWSIAKRLLDERDTRQYTELAEQYDLPVHPGHLGRVLKRAAEALPEADLALLDRALTSAGAASYNEIGYNGYTESDVMSQVSAMANEAVTKHDLSSEQAIVALFEANPQAYDEYLAESR